MATAKKNGKLKTNRGRVGDIEAQLGKTRKIQETVQSAVEAYVTSMAEADPSGGWLHDLPPNVRAGLITQFVPKTKDVEQSFQQKALSLTESLEHLDDVPELDKVIMGMRHQVWRLEQTCMVFDRMFKDWRGKDDKFDMVCKAFEDIYKIAHEDGRRMKIMNFETPKEHAETIRPYLHEKSYRVAHKTYPAAQSHFPSTNKKVTE